MNQKLILQPVKQSSDKLSSPLTTVVSAKIVNQLFGQEIAKESYSGKLKLSHKQYFENQTNQFSAILPNQINEKNKGSIFLGNYTNKLISFEIKGTINNKPASKKIQLLPEKSTWVMGFDAGLNAKIEISTHHNKNTAISPFLGLGSWVFYKK